MAKRITRNIKATSIDLDKMKDFMQENDLLSDGEKAYILVGNQLLEITSGGDEVDLSPYAKKTDLNSYAKKTELPDLSDLEKDVKDLKEVKPVLKVAGITPDEAGNIRLTKTSTITEIYDRLNALEKSDPKEG